MAEQPKPVTGYPAVQGHYANAQPAGYQNSGTAVPYPPPPPYYPNPYPPQPTAASYYPPRRTTTILRRLILAMISVFLIIGAITFILWLVLRPHVPEFSIDSATVSQFNVSDGKLTANWDVSVSVQNRNKKMGVYYDRIEAFVLYGPAELAETSLAPFYQSRRNSTMVIVNFAVLSDYVEGGLAKNIADERSHGAVNFHVRLIAWVRFRAGAWRTRRHLMRVFCEHVKIGWGGGSNSTALGVGSLLAQSRCAVDL